MHTTVAWLGGLDVGRPHIDFNLPIPLINISLGISFIAVFSAVLQVLQSRMTMPPIDPSNPDPNARLTRQTMVILPLFFVFYAGFLPAGLYIYYTAGTIISIIQQYLIVGWGSLFPLFGWNPCLRHGPHTALPGRPSGAETDHASGGSTGAIRDLRETSPGPCRPGPDGERRQDRALARTRPPGPTRETTLT